MAGAARLLAENADLAGGGGEQAEEDLEEGGLAGAVGAEHGDELAAADGEVDAAPQDAAADPDRRAAEFQHGARGCGRGRRGLACWRGLVAGGLGARERVQSGVLVLHPGRFPGYRPVAWCRADSSRSSWLTCHCSKVRFAGVSVSVTVVTGMCRALASRTWAVTSGVAFWLL